MKTNSDTSNYLASSASRRKFVLSRRGNERGQVAIFVALIFQVVFVFFALLINVGLLVHHKINLQHSTDLAAYYGAMKQAEQMNAIAHINFQMRQAWKLLTWRYRVLGTFGFIQKTGQQVQKFPFNLTNLVGFEFLGTGGGANVATPSNPTQNGGVLMKCNNVGGINGNNVGTQDIPFFCVGHSGFHSWPNDDSSCQAGCDDFDKVSIIRGLPSAPSASIFGNNFAASADQLTKNANFILTNKCTQLGPVGAELLTKFLAAYAVESVTRSETIKMLAANLSGDVGQFVDLDGKSIREGSKRTFENNLTGANFTGYSQSGSFSAYNGLNANTCRFQGGRDSSTEFLKKIDFQVLNFYIQNCTVINGSNGSPPTFTFAPEAVYDQNSPNGLSRAFKDLSPNSKSLILSFLNQDNSFSTGYEKNPNCVEYFAVKASSEPNIPFLPLAKIRLDATAIAKPFGGSIGPTYGTVWQGRQSKSVYDDNNPLTKTDKTLPSRKFNANANNKITESINLQPNFSLFLGDRLGLRNLDYLASYHSMLVMRDILPYSGKSYGSNKNTITNKFSNVKVPTTTPAWPDYSNWQDIDQYNTDLKPYDSLASSDSAIAGTRAIEISAIAPNQFDVAYYSIDPDFYNNYYIKLYKNFSAIKQASGGSVNLTADQIRADFGAKDMDGSQKFTQLDEKSFSVKDQILLKNKVLDTPPQTRVSYQIPGSNGNNKYSGFLNYLLSYQTSILTGWTFLHFNNYKDFPDGLVDRGQNKTMSFGNCDDPWNKSSDYTSDSAKIADDSFRTPMNSDADNPPTPGNCVTGGRTGYSVKLVSPSVMLDPGFLNPMPTSFFTFPP